MNHLYLVNETGVMLRLDYEMQRDLGKMYWLLMAGKETAGRMTYFQPSRTVATEEISSRMILLVQIGAAASASTQGVYSKPMEQKGSVGKTGEAPEGQHRTALSLRTTVEREPKEECLPEGKEIIKNFYSSKDIIKRMERQTTDHEKNIPYTYLTKDSFLEYIKNSCKN